MTTAERKMSSAEILYSFELFTRDAGQAATVQMMRALDAWQSGLMSTEELQEALAWLLATTNAVARGYADVFAAAVLESMELVERPRPTGKSPAWVHVDAEGARLRAAVGTVLVALDQGEDIRMQLERLAGAEPANAAQQQVLATYRNHGVDGYTRGLSSDACELCHWLYKDGYVYPTDKPMHQHAGCRCTPIPTKGN